VYNSAHLEELLSRLAAHLQSQRAKVILSNFVQRYINETMDIVENELETVKPIALAKLLPFVSKAVPRVSDLSSDSILQQNICSSELYQLCQSVFIS